MSDKQKEFITKSIHKYGNKFNYSKVVYLNKGTKIILICTDCGTEFTATPDSHLQSKYGCKVCAANIRKAAETARFANEFINKANKVHPNLYTYDKVKYVNNHTKVSIYCKKHSKYFAQEPGNHLQGNGCPICGREKVNNLHRTRSVGWSHSKWDQAGLISSNFKHFAIYVIKCVDEKTGETFIKVGKTFKLLEKRFSTSVQMPYAWKVLYYKTGESKFISELESELHRNLKKAGYKYLPNKKFCGMYECYKADMKVKEEEVIDADVE